MLTTWEREGGGRERSRKESFKHKLRIEHKQYKTESLSFHYQVFLDLYIVFALVLKCILAFKVER
jgi:hypothetical protein